MGTQMVNEALRWIFWGLLYLAVTLTSMVFFFGVLSGHVSGPVRWAMLGVFLFGIALDIRQKVRRRRETPRRPPGGGHLAPSPSRV
ncbi:hypothetical protein JQN72_00310 [Phycicoccus sp. CSK15P-2]|uniref:hypothetical protein n=1 Tax=Phycicoccus sp. CSK15P-2 TaxID=2807627 RepID=UPI0019508A2A|nr:hypothetical protein [Phycicoccus sp. CSK15P-2]MBM6402686.1 hypothetical protein [Phycicoccus sp. CSK15P-2]